MQAGVCVAVIIMILLMATIIWLSVHGKISKLPLQSKSIKETGGGWGTDVCKCNGNVSMIYWQGESPNIVYCKVGYVKFGMAGIDKGGYAEKWGTPKNGAHTFDDSCAEFYHGNILKAFANAPSECRRCKDWIFCNLPLSLGVSFGNTVHDIPASEFRIGIAGCAEIFARAYVLARIMQEHKNDIVSIRFASNGGDKNKKIENIPDDIQESGWSYICSKTIPFSPWGNKAGEVFEFKFNSSDDTDYTTSFKSILETLDMIFKKWETAAPFYKFLSTINPETIDARFNQFPSDVDPATIANDSSMVIDNNASALQQHPYCGIIDLLVRTETARWRNTLASRNIPDVLRYCMIESISTKYALITEKMESSKHPYGRGCPPL